MSRRFLLLLLVALVACIGAPFVLAAHTSPPVQRASTNSKTSSNTFISNQHNVPVAGTFKFGMQLGSLKIATIEQDLGHRLALVGFFIHFNQPLDSATVAYACQNGYVPLITWEGWNGPSGGLSSTNSYPLTSIANGTYDAYLKQTLTALSAACTRNTVIIRFDHEFDTPAGVVGWYPWQGDPPAYVAAWKHVVSLGRAIDPNIKWLWSPNRASVAAKSYYPGDSWVDYVGLTLNRNGAVLSQPNPPQSFAQFYRQNQGIEAYGKPVLIGETTTPEDPMQPGVFKARWITDMFTFVRSDPHIVGLVWFNTGSTYVYDSSPEAAQAFRSSL